MLLTIAIIVYTLLTGVVVYALARAAHDSDLALARQEGALAPGFEDRSAPPRPGFTDRPDPIAPTLNPAPTGSSR